MENQPVKISVTTTINEIPREVTKFLNEVLSLLQDSATGLRQAGGFLGTEELGSTVNTIEAVRRFLFKADQRLSDCAEIVTALNTHREEAAAAESSTEETSVLSQPSTPASEESDSAK